ncbi:protein ACCELERATED CELL DEATH 6 [Triticum aestivum]|uniref:protein ACCELERATED CELL DEATH 6 n=1 Tax=Triticum aestivum TaxID=4565 RepID=UPI001D00BCDE|nr:protein ACCELERATED CELL DEATH 6-like [Triticum aestivum]
MESGGKAPSGPPKDKEAKAKPAVVQQHPKLLMAARKGHWTPLNVLMGNSGAGATPPAVHAVPPGGLINIVIDDEQADVVDNSATTITLDVELNNVLHVVASSGDGDEFLESARGIYCKAKHLLDGSFPIHEAVKEKQVSVVCTLLKICPDCAQLRDAEGKTFLHVAAKQGYAKLFPPVLQVLLQEKQMFAAIMNMQDDDGNTGLHLAVEAGILETVCFLLWDKEVMLNLSNNERETALDLSQRMRTPGVLFGLGRRVSIHKLLVHADAQYGVHSKTRIPELNEEKEEKRISDSTQTIGVVSALLVTISFAVAFTIPGGYRTDDDPKVDNIKGGMPVLVTSHSLQAFIIANNLALLCSAMATISLMYAGVTTVDISMRMKAFVMSIFFLNSSARTLAAAFALGMYATLVPAAGAAVTLTVIGTTITLLDVAWFTYMTSKDQLVLRKRMGVGVALKWFALLVLRGVLACLWPYVIIGGFLAYITLWSK